LIDMIIRHAIRHFDQRNQKKRSVTAVLSHLPHDCLIMTTMF
jgi:hypothetical protein